MTLRAPISDLEREVMNIIWSRGSATAANVQKVLAAERPLKDSTIRTVLMRLEEKGYVQHEVDGRTFVYSCVEPAGSVAARAVKEILDRFCHGSLESLLAGMVDDELVDTDELRKIADRLGRERSKAVSGKERKKPK
ncbi:MAG TPA: BlaI/MecI/CopY family transcriptional regulator [Bryobacteraceae bacterium]